MANRGSRFPSARVAPRSKRMSAWDEAAISAGQAIASSAKTGWATGSSLATETAATIVRIRGYVQVILTVGTSAGDGFQCAVGLGLIEDTAFSIGITALPGPISDPEWPGWMYHKYFSIRSLGVQDAAINAQSNVLRFEIDSKAMRKEKAGQTFFGMWETIETGTASGLFDGRVRVLNLLS